MEPHRYKNPNRSDRNHCFLTGVGGLVIGFLLMELCEGGDLASRIVPRAGVVGGPRAFWSLATALARGVRDIHAAGLVHLDLKARRPAGRRARAAVATRRSDAPTHRPTPGPRATTRDKEDWHPAPHPHSALTPGWTLVRCFRPSSTVLVVQPQNILLTRRGELRIGDFGLACRHDLDDGSADHTRIGGTRCYQGATRRQGWWQRVRLLSRDQSG